jgi:hypothetical protein
MAKSSLFIRNSSRNLVCKLASNRPQQQGQEKKPKIDKKGKGKNKH